MPALQIPPELKKITPYVRRAEELDKDTSNPESRLVAYYCRQYAVHTGISLAVKDESKSCLGVLLGNLEGEKMAMDSFTRDEAKFLCTKFANKIFDNADLEDRTGDASKNTARVFYAAGSFLDILQQFYQDDDTSEELSEIKKKSKYAKWKAAEILKAINEGRKPTPGGYGESPPEDEEDSSPSSDDAAPRDPSPKAPAVKTVTDDDSADEKEEAPSISPPSPKDDEGTEVELGPPPAFPDLAPPAMPPPAVHKPPLKFNPAPVAPPKPAPPPKKDDYDDIPAATPKKTSFFGLGGGGSKKNNGKLSKAELADASELTTFALAALADKDADLAADRLEQALRVLGRL
jgi:vacuolar protein sorting-associated protein VTA1